MSIYNIDQQQVFQSYNLSGETQQILFDVSGNTVFEEGYALGQTYKGGYIEIQPDSWDGSTVVTGDLVQASDPTAWGFPMSLSSASKAAIKSDILNGENGIKYIRFPLGFAYRGSRNIQSNGLAKNIGERWSGQNDALRSWFSSIAESGGGLAPEYWCIAPYWLTGGAYSATNNKLNAGGNYSQSTPLSSIRTSDAQQYQAQINDFTDAVINDLKYLDTNIAPVKMFGLSNEPTHGTHLYGACSWDAQTYNDVLAVLYQKLREEFPDILLHVASSDESSPFTGIASTFIANHSDWIWGYSHHSMRLASGEVGNGADEYYKSSTYSSIKGNKQNVFINEYEYFRPDNAGSDNFKCGNNMVHLIDEIVYGGAEVLHPIIHICKPTGQTSQQTNTTGYCLYQVNMSNGSYTVNTWAYNSWKMFNDNLLFGSTLIKNYTVDVAGIGFMVMLKNDKLRVFVANSTNEQKTLTLNFLGEKTFQTKLYNMENLGTVLSQSSAITTLSVPAYSGICCIET